MKNIVTQLIGATAMVSSLGLPTVLVPAAAASKAPLLLAQQNPPVATLKCGPYKIDINFQGDYQGREGEREVYTYRTKGLFLRDGTRDGDDYIFDNNDYEYRVTTRGGGVGRLAISHYGEGYIIEVEDRHLRFAIGGPMATNEDLLIPIEAVDLNTLSYWDQSKTCYVDALWNENQQKWVFK